LYYGKAYVDALCGCAVLIRRSAILDRQLLFGPMFAYYEDSELSHWLIGQGYRILYQPASQVFHRHSESTVERSLSWNVLVNRSKQLYETVTKDRDADLRCFQASYPKEFSGPLRATLEAYDDKIREAGSFRSLMAPPRRTACIYNTYINSMGGGEKHAFDIAHMLSANFDVYIASETDFDIQQLESYFGVDLSLVRKIVCNNIDAHFTSKFDLFVNSTFLSQLMPAAKENLYIVSFPQKEIDPGLLRKYRFLHNSPFTQKWATSYWGEHRMETILPILGQQGVLAATATGKPKEKAILSVGRFTYEGHRKNHPLIVKAYRDLVDTRRLSPDWRLEIVGSCDQSRPDAVEYCNDLIVASRGYNISILANAGREVLRQAYAHAAIYVHAAGLETATDKPELHEHFGISTFEALANGCQPVVYHLGGPAEQVEGLRQAQIFRDFESLKEAILAACASYDADHAQANPIRAHAAAMYERNLTEAGKIFKSIREEIGAGDIVQGIEIREAADGFGP
jgi:glycosyltransferase involved in cell wall biosynthesis